MSNFRQKDSFTKEDPWRIFRIMSEFVDGFEELSDVTDGVAIFGSARTKPSDPFYRAAEETASLLVKEGYTVITGAGAGIMEAGNKGAKGAKGESIGLNILIPINQRPNKYVTRLIDFKYFFCRKVMFAKYSKAVVVFPGGYGTLDEFFELITLIQTQRVEPMPVVVVGKTYWKGLVDWIEATLLRKHSMIDRTDLAIFSVVDRPSEVVDAINHFYGTGSRKMRGGREG